MQHNTGGRTDQRDFFDTSTQHLRHIQHHGYGFPHNRIQQWQYRLQIQIHLPSLWWEIWRPFRSSSENCFLWQMIYQIPAIQHWRFPHLPASDSQTWCTRCTIDNQEDIVHCIWGCPISQRVWWWVLFLLQISSDSPNSMVTLHMANIFLAQPIQVQHVIPKRLWSLVN